MIAVTATFAVIKKESPLGVLQVVNLLAVPRHDVDSRVQDTAPFTAARVVDHEFGRVG